jgi:hypothetical protein
VKVPVIIGLLLVFVLAVALFPDASVPVHRNSVAFDGSIVQPVLAGVAEPLVVDVAVTVVPEEGSVYDPVQ